MKPQARILLSVLGLISIASFLFFNLEGFPGLHGDEAWVGLYAGRVKAYGLYTPHLMNDYTGALFGWGVFGMLEAFGGGARVLRSLSAGCNALAAVGFVLWAGRRFGTRGALVMAALLASSGMFLIYGRVAWEVCAFENLLVLAILWSCRPFIEDGRFPLVSVLVFFAALEFGVLNHFIFLSVPLSLAVYAAAAGALLQDRRAARLRPLFFLGLLLAACCYCKRYLTPEAFVAYRPFWLGLALALPFIFAALFKSVETGRVRFRYLEAAPARRAMRFVLGAGMAAFLVWHLAPMIQILSGVAMMRRVSALEPVWPLRWALYAWGAGLMFLLLHRLQRVLRSPAASEGAYARFVILWAGAYMAVFILLRHTSSIRYYLIMHMLTLAAIAVAGARGRFLADRRIAVPALLAVLGLHGFYWLEAAATPARTPLRFRVGFRREKSIDFMDKRELFARLDADRVCRWDQSKQDFLYIPAIFHRQRRPVDCDYTLEAALDYCWDCAEPPFYSYALVKSE